MPWKVDAEGKVASADGKPVFVHADGKETGFDGDQALAKISSLQAESKIHREAKEAAELALAPYKAIGDPAEVTSLVEKAKKVEAKKLIDAGDVDKYNAERDRGWQEKVDAETKRATALETALFEEKVGAKFGTSKFVKDKLIVAPLSARQLFGSNFKLENGEAIGYLNGTKITSREKFGEPAGFDEALEIIVQAHPEKDNLMRSAAGNGSGAPPSPPPDRTATKQPDMSKFKPEERLTAFFADKMKDQLPPPGPGAR
jgi:hypothetical protein